MKLPSAALLVALLTASILGAATAAGDPGPEPASPPDNSAFLASLQRAGISYSDADQAISAAQAVCGLVDNGKSGLEVLRQVMSANPDITTDGAAQFTAIAASAYCPQQLAGEVRTK